MLNYQRVDESSQTNESPDFHLFVCAEADSVGGTDIEATP